MLRQKDGPLSRVIDQVYAFAAACPERGYPLPLNRDTARICVASLSELEEVLLEASAGEVTEAARSRILHDVFAEGAAASERVMQLVAKQCNAASGSPLHGSVSQLTADPAWLAAPNAKNDAD